MIGRKKTRSDDGRESPDTLGSKTVRQTASQGEAKKPKPGSRNWEETVLEKWRGALVKARLALRKKREKKKEQHVKSTLARLRKIADARRKKSPEEETKNVPKRRGRPPLAAKAVEKAQALNPVVTQSGSKKIPKNAKSTSDRVQGDDGELKLNGESIKAVSKVRRGRKPGSKLSQGLGSEAKSFESIDPSPSADLDDEDLTSAEVEEEMERREEVKNKWRSALVIARVALRKKRDRKRERSQEAATRRLRRSEALDEDNSIVQVGFSLKRPSVEELRNFAKRSRS